MLWRRGVSSVISACLMLGVFYFHLSEATVICKGGLNCCETNICGLGEGPCNNDDQCSGSLRCGTNNCVGNTFGTGDSCCEEDCSYVRGEACTGGTANVIDVSQDECIDRCKMDERCNCVTWFHERDANKCVLETGLTATPRGTDIYSALPMSKCTFKLSDSVSQKFDCTYVRGEACTGVAIMNINIDQDECIERCKMDAGCNCVTWFHTRDANKCQLATGTATPRGKNIFSAVTMDKCKSCPRPGDLIESGLTPLALNLGQAPKKLEGAGLKPILLTPKQIKDTCS